MCNKIAQETFGDYFFGLFQDILDELRNVSLSVPKFAAVIAEASKRCCELTEGQYFLYEF